MTEDIRAKRKGERLIIINETENVDTVTLLERIELIMRHKTGCFEECFTFRDGVQCLVRHDKESTTYKFYGKRNEFFGKECVSK